MRFYLVAVRFQDTPAVWESARYYEITNFDFALSLCESYDSFGHEVVLIEVENDVMQAMRTFR